MSRTHPPRNKKEIKADCRHFLGDRPCIFHKVEGVKCEKCKDYSPAGMRILVVKLGAMGDVLRTTSILPALRKKYGRPHITWITRKESLDLLDRNSMVDCLMAYDTESISRLQIETFDLMINPEASKESAALASIAKGKEKRGFGLSPEGSIYPLNEEAEEYFRMGLFDDVKKRNSKTYEQLICQLSDLPFDGVPPMLSLTDDELRAAEELRLRHRIQKGKPVVGINTGGGSRWLLKRWTLEGFINLAKRVSTQMDGQILLLGGPMETEINRQITSELGEKAVDTGCFNSPREFATLIQLCDVVVTGDSLALHIGLALHKRMVVLFGPTSETEVDLYGLGSKITAEMDCLCCYRQTCDKSPNCMEMIAVEKVYQAVKEQAGLIDRGSR